jgi:hypothetical protein
MTRQCNWFNFFRLEGKDGKKKIGNMVLGLKSAYHPLNRRRENK